MSRADVRQKMLLLAAFICTVSELLHPIFRTFRTSVGDDVFIVSSYIVLVPKSIRRPGRCPEIPDILKVVLKCTEFLTYVLKKRKLH